MYFPGRKIYDVCSLNLVLRSPEPKKWLIKKNNVSVCMYIIVVV